MAYFRYKRKAKPPTKMYGIAIRYTMPLLTPSAIELSASLSKTARHMAHWACDVVNVNKTKQKNIILTAYLGIIRRNHCINYNAGNSYIQPNWKSNFCNFFMPLEIVSYCSNIGNQHKWNNNNRQCNMSN